MEGGDNEEKEEEEEEMVVPLGRILRLNSKEWWLLVLGVLGSIVSGCVFPLYAILFGELLMVFLMPVESVLSPSLLLLPYFLALGFGSGVGVFLKVHLICTYIHTYIHTCTYIHAYAYIHTYVHTFIHYVHTCTCFWYCEEQSIQITAFLPNSNDCFFTSL